MPEILKEFFRSLSVVDKDKMWDYLDGDPDAIHEMIELVATEDGEYNFRQGGV